MSKKILYIHSPNIKDHVQAWQTNLYQFLMLTHKNKREHGQTQTCRQVEHVMWSAQTGQYWALMINEAPSLPHSAKDSDSLSTHRPLHHPHAVSVIHARHVMYRAHTAPPALVNGCRNSIVSTWRCLVMSLTAPVHSNCITDVTYTVTGSQHQSQVASINRCYTVTGSQHQQVLHSHK